MNMREQIEAAAARYPDQRSAIMPALLIAQQEHGYLPGPVLEEVADILGVERVWVYELATFYTLFHPGPVGLFHLQLCDNVSCMLCGSDELLRHLEAVLGIEKGGTTPDGLFTLSTVECLGACEMAPVMQVGDDYHGDLDIVRLDALLGRLRMAARQAAARQATARQATGAELAAPGPPGE
jgi:NADH-quinone oxidoreductase subunit E